jgi:hypothetical protein
MSLEELTWLLSQCVVVVKVVKEDNDGKEK